MYCILNRVFGFFGVLGLEEAEGFSFEAAEEAEIFIILEQGEAVAL